MKPPPMYPETEHYYRVQSSQYGVWNWTGPTSYLCSKKCFIAFFIILFGQLIVKVVIGIILMISLDGFSLFLGLVYWGSAVNVWAQYLAQYKRYQTLSRYSIRNLVKLPFMYLFFLESLIFLGTPALDYDLKRHMWAGVVMTLINSVMFIVVTRTEVDDYAPFSDTHLFEPVSTYEETGNDNQLTVREWGPFKIRIANIGCVTVTEHLTVIRSVHQERGRKAEDVVLKVQLTSPLEPGSEITLIPETHTLAGAYQIKNHRSFGRDRNHLVELVVIVGDKKPFSVRRCQVFKKKYYRIRYKNVDCQDLL